MRNPKSCPMTFNQELAVLEKYPDSCDCVMENCMWWIEPIEMCAFVVNALNEYERTHKK